MPEPLPIRCLVCGATNRVVPDKLAEGFAPVCGRCKTLLPLPGQPFEVTDQSFAAAVERSSLPVLVDAWAPWCGPCRMIAPAVDQLAAELEGRVRVAKLNVDENPQTAERFGLRSIPTLLIFAKGHEVDRIVGAQPKEEIARRLARAIS
jgi:thioredoxin 2